MRRGRILSIALLGLFLFSIATPTILAKTEFSFEEPKLTSKVYTKHVFDVDGDKIDDNLMKNLNDIRDSVINVVVEFNDRITDNDLVKLHEAGATLSSDIWALGRNTLVQVNRDSLDRISQIDNVNFVTTADTRFIVVAIDGDDFSELAALEEFDAEILWGIGCAIIRDYTGTEFDVAQAGSYSVIADTTGMMLYPTLISEESDDTIGINTQTTVNQINVSSLWSQGYDGDGVKVGNIDTGVNSDHDDFSGRIAAAKSFVTTAYGYDYDDTTTDDYANSGHGSHTSGTILGDGTVVAANIGVAPDASLYFAKVGDWKEDMAPATLVSIVAALDWLATTKGVDCVNFSYGGTDSVGNDLTEIAFRNAVRQRDVICCISAGNEGAEGYYTAGSPGTTDDVITVANADTSSGAPFSMAYSSSRGLSADDRMKPDVAAPGTSIISCSNVGDAYRTLSGTSMAAPHVTGSVAVLLDACASNGIAVNPGLIKAALMHTADPISAAEILIQGRGFINVGAAFNYILKATTENSYKRIGAINPSQSPLPFWTDLLQGQVTEQYITCITPYTTNVTIDITGTASQFMTSTLFKNSWTQVQKVTYSIPVDATVGAYTGTIALQYNNQTLDTCDIVLNVVESKGKRMLLSFRHTDWSIDHMYGQFAEFTEGILDEGFVISEQVAELDSGILDNYEAVWLPDPFDVIYPDAVETGDYSVSDTYNPLSTSEQAALDTYIANGGSVFFCFNGYATDTVDGYGTLNFGTNVSAINDWTSQYGITVNTDEWSSTTLPLDTVITHPLTAGVTAVDHNGASISVSDDAEGIVLLGEGADATCAVYQHPNGGRIIVCSTNFIFDTIGYINGYNTGVTQNDQFSKNLVRWATAENRITKDNITVSGDTVSLKYEVLIDAGGAMTGYVTKPDLSKETLVLTETTAGFWEVNYTCTEVGLYEFYVECGTSGEDDFGYFRVTITEEVLAGIEFMIVTIITGFGLAGYVLIQKYRK